MKRSDLESLAWRMRDIATADFQESEKASNSKVAEALRKRSGDWSDAANRVIQIMNDGLADNLLEDSEENQDQMFIVLHGKIVKSTFRKESDALEYVVMGNEV